MQVYKLHDMLSKSLGDIIDISPLLNGNTNIISDGVVYSKSHRDDILNRAMLNYISMFVINVANLPKKVARTTIYRVFPHLVTQSGNQTINDCIIPLFAFYEEEDNLGNIKKYALPIKDDPLEIQGLLNNRNI